MNTKIRQGQFEVIDSFVIRRRNEFYLIGQLKEGTVREQWFINIPLNRSLSMTVRIASIEEVEISTDRHKYMLLIVTGEEEILNILLSMKIESELLDITIEGGD